MAQDCELIRPDLYSVGGAVEADVRQRWVPAEAEKWLPIHAYVLTGGPRLVMIDTSITVLRCQIENGLRELKADEATIDVALTRYNYDTLVNLPWLRKRFTVDQLYSSSLADSVLGAKAAMSFMDAFEDAHVDAHLDSIIEVRPASMPQNQDVEIAGRLMRCVRAPVRLLATNWIYDYDTRTLFSSDMWTFGTIDGPDSSRVISASDSLDKDAIEENLLYRFDWLEGVETGDLRKELREFFDTYPVEQICPTHGCAISGAERIQELVETTDEILADLEKRDPRPVMAGLPPFPTRVVHVNEIEAVR